MPMEIAPVLGTSPTLPAGYQSRTSGASETGSSFAATLGGAMDQLQSLQATSNELAIQAAAGELPDIHTATLAATRASVAMEMAVTFRNRGVEAFNEIMRMQA